MNIYEKTSLIISFIMVIITIIFAQQHNNRLVNDCNNLGGKFIHGELCVKDGLILK